MKLIERTITVHWTGSEHIDDDKLEELCKALEERVDTVLRTLVDSIAASEMGKAQPEIVATYR